MSQVMLLNQLSWVRLCLLQQTMSLAVDFQNLYILFAANAATVGHCSSEEIIGMLEVLT